MKNTHLNKFVRSYLATGVWVEFESDEMPETVSKEAIRLAFEDCQRFIDKVKELFSKEDADYILKRPGSDLDLLAPHEFYLTRNRHGAGFWDGDWDEHGDKLTKICHEMKECQLYTGDDNKAYFM
jgi:hypothetical protein